MDTDTTAVETDLSENKAGGDKGPPLPPLRLLAEDHEDLLIISAALQDAILTPGDILWESASRRIPSRTGAG